MVMDKLYTYELKIPKERVAVLIGTKGETKRKLEEVTGVNIEVDSKEGDVFLHGQDAIGLFNARELVQAIGRGFNPEIAALLLKQDFIFESLKLTEYVGRSKASESRLKGRVIGKEGKARKHLEELTETYIVIYGKTISIIGEVQNVTIAKKAVESLLAGSRHATVYKWLEKKRRLRNDFSPDDIAVHQE